VSSNIGQNYPYSSEAEADRARAVDDALLAHPGLRERIAAESVALPAERRWWVWKCPAKGCRGLLHSAGFARDAHAIYVVCDICGQTYKR
jgi:hypothetical protein